MIKLLKNFTKKDWLLSLLILIFILFQVWLDLKMPDYVSEITRLIQTEGTEIKSIIINGGYMLLCALGSLLSAILVGYLVSMVSASFSMNVRSKLFKKVLDLSYHDVKQFSTSSLITRTTNDITQIQMVISMGLQTLIKAPITAILAISKILNKNIEWSIITLIGVIVLTTTILIIMFIVTPRFKKVQKLIDNLNGITRENLIGIRVIRAFNAEDYQLNKFEDVNENLTKTQLFNQKVFAFLSPVMYLVMHGLTLSIYFVGAFLIKDALFADKLTIFGNMIVFSSYATQVIMSFLMLSMIFMMLPRASVSANRINEVINTTSLIKEGNVSRCKEKGTVEFKNVSFKYPDAEEYILKDISFKANKGETVAFIGLTGSGKSTLINLVPRFYDVTEGEVLVNGVNVKDYKQEYLNNKIGYVPQKAIIFNDTVINNVGYGDNGKRITLKKIKEAIKVAEAENFVLQMDNGYNTNLSQGGTNISGGQKQRLSIARAIAKEPEIYIFDDTFSALDYKTDSNLRKNLKKYTKDATVLIVAQRIGTIISADRILVINEGRIVGNGTHKELLKTCDIYKEIALSQLSKEELENA